MTNIIANNTNGTSLTREPVAPQSEASAGTAIQPRTAAINEWSDGFQRLVTQTVLKPKNRTATPAELALLAEHAVRTSLDPMSRQIYGIYRYDSRAGGEVMTLQVGIDGLRAIAERTGRYIGQAGPFWCGADGVWREVWLDRTAPVAAKVIVRKVIAGHVAETPAVAHFDEYVPRKRDGSAMGLWGEKPALMLAKCAEALALRKAFPADMSGLYTDDEMARADARAAIPVAVPSPLNAEALDASHAHEGSAEVVQPTDDAPAGIAAAADRNGDDEGTPSEDAAAGGREAAAPEPEPEDADVVDAVPAAEAREVARTAKLVWDGQQLRREIAACTGRDPGVISTVKAAEAAIGLLDARQVDVLRDRIEQATLTDVLGDAASEEEA